MPLYAGGQAALPNAALLPRRIARASSFATGQPWAGVLPQVQTSANGRALLVTLADTGVGATVPLRNDPPLLHR